jgi:diguanylate cyclase (GGDEF)-like protein
MQQSLTLTDILEVIISGAHDVLGIDRINLMLPSSDGTFLECRAAVGNDEEPLEQIRVPLGGQGGALASAFERKEIIRYEEDMIIPPSLKLTEPYSGIRFLRSRGFVVVPLVVKDHAVGVIGLDNKPSRRSISEAQINLMSIFANQAAVAVENARLYDELRQKIQELDAKVDQLSILHQIGNSMQRVTSREEALGFIMRGIREGMGFEEVILCLVNRDEGVLQGEMGLGVPMDAVKTLRIPLYEEENLLVMSAAGKRPVGIVHFQHEGLMDVVASPLRKESYRESLNVPVAESRVAVVAVPLVAQEEVVGTVVVARKHPPVIKRSDVELLMLYANTAGLTVERAEFSSTMHQDLEHLEITDHISRLFTHRYGQQRVKEEIAKCRGTEQSLSVALLGIDEFKEYNDRCGHEVGDAALGQIGELVKKCIRNTDFAYRYGGRLMVVIFPATEKGKAVEIAEGIQKLMRTHRFPGPSGGRDQKLSLSIGVVESCGAEGITAEADFFRDLLGLLHRVEAEGGDGILAS